MGLFGRKKKSSDSLRTLSEEEIQKKLYGGIRSSEKTRQNNPLQQQRPQSSLAPVGTNLKPFKPVSAGGVATQERPSSQSRPASPDLFTPSPPAVERPAATVAPVLPREVEKEPVPQPKQASQPVPAEAPVSGSGRFSQPSGVRPGSKAKKWNPGTAAPVRNASKPRPAVKPARKPWVEPILKKAGELMLVFLGSLFSLIRLCVKLVDFRRPAVRRFLYWIAGGVLLVTLFLSIHYLNVNREQAMRGKRSASAPAAVPAASPEKPVVKAAESESLSESDRGTSPASAAPAPEKKPEKAVPAEIDSAERDPEAFPYVIQVATYTGNLDASRMVKKLREQQLPAFSKTLQRPSGKMYYSVFIGRYKDYASAQQEFARFKNEDIARPFQDAFIRSLN